MLSEDVIEDRACLARNSHSNCHHCYTTCKDGLKTRFQILFLPLTLTTEKNLGGLNLQEQMLLANANLLDKLI